MAQLVDAPDSKSGDGDIVRVRFSLPAPRIAYHIAAASAGMKACTHDARILSYYLSLKSQVPRPHNKRRTGQQEWHVNCPYTCSKNHNRKLAYDGHMLQH